MLLDGNELYVFQDFRLDVVERLLLRNGERVQLPEKAFETLCVLVRRNGHLVTKDELLAEVWPDTVVEENNLDKNVSLLRRVLGDVRGKQKFIETVRGRGYRFNGAVRISEETYRLLPNAIESSPVQKVYGPRVERRGNVLALVDWKEDRHEVVENPAPARNSPSSFPIRRRLILAIGGTAILLLASVLLWRNYASEKRDAAAPGDLNILTLTNGEPLGFATISPDGNYFVYTTGDDERAHLWLQQTGQASRTEIIPPFDGAIYGTTFTPDSKFVYYIANERPNATNALYRVPALGGVRTRVLSDIMSPVSISPDGSHLVFVRWDQEASRSLMIIASSDGTRERVLLSKAGDEAINGAAWSPDGSLIAYGAITLIGAEGQCTITAIDLVSEETRSLSPERWDTCYRMAWTPDGKGLAFIGTKFREAHSTRRDQIFYLSIGDGRARRLTTEGSRHQATSIGVTDSDEFFAVPFNRSSQLWSMDSRGDSRTAVQITTGQADGRSGLEPLTNGSIAYLTRNGDGFSIWSVDSDGTNRRQITTEPPAIEELRGAPDGQYYIFAAKSDRYSHLFRVDANGADLKQLTFGDSQEIDSDISPDGDWIVFDSTVFDGSYGRSALWKIRSEGGTPIRVADIDCRTPHYSPDGRSISCVSKTGTTISTISADNGSIVGTYEADKNAILNVGSRWTPDGKALAYIAFHSNANNIWVQPVNGDAKYRLTDFTSGDIYNFAFGATDSRLYLARGHSIRNAILISGFR